MRKKMSIYIHLFLSLFLFGALFGQVQSTKSNLFDPSMLLKKPKGLLDSVLDPAKFSMSHSYTLSYHTFGKQGYSQGLYLNTMNYQFSDPLFMQVRVGYLHNPFGQNTSQNSNGNLFIERVMFQYKPFKNTVVHFDYQAMPSPLMVPYTRYK